MHKQVSNITDGEQDNIKIQDRTNPVELYIMSFSKAFVVLSVNDLLKPVVMCYFCTQRNFTLFGRYIVDMIMFTLAMHIHRLSVTLANRTMIIILMNLYVYQV